MQILVGAEGDWRTIRVVDADLLDRAGQDRVPLALVGSLALAVRGVDVRPGDIDVITTVEGADALGDSYRDVLVVPVADEGPWPLNPSMTTARPMASTICRT